MLVEIAIAVRRYKSENSISLGTELQRLLLATEDVQLATQLEDASGDLSSITRALEIDITKKLPQASTTILDTGRIKAAIVP